MTTMITVLDPDEVKERIDDEYISHGFFRPNHDGEQVVDEGKMKAHVYEVVRKKVARAKEEVAKNSVSNGELYALTFPDAPGTDAKKLPGLTDMEAEIRKNLKRKVWGLTQDRRNGFIQKRLGSDATGLVLCRTMSTRGLEDAEVCFVTDNPDLIMNESVIPQIETLVNKANDLRLHTEMVTIRRPELRGRVRAELFQGVRRVEAALPSGEDTPAEDAGEPTA